MSRLTTLSIAFEAEMSAAKRSYDEFVKFVESRPINVPLNAAGTSFAGTANSGVTFSGTAIGPPAVTLAGHPLGGGAQAQSAMLARDTGGGAFLGWGDRRGFQRFVNAEPTGGGGGAAIAGAAGAAGLRLGRLGQYASVGFALREAWQIGGDYLSMSHDLALAGNSQTDQLGAIRKFNESVSLTGEVGSSLADVFQSTYYGRNVSRVATELESRGAELGDQRSATVQQERRGLRRAQREADIAEARSLGSSFEAERLAAGGRYGESVEAAQTEKTNRATLDERIIDNQREERRASLDTRAHAAAKQVIRDAIASGEAELTPENDIYVQKRALLDKADDDARAKAQKDAAEQRDKTYNDTTEAARRQRDATNSFTLRKEAASYGSAQAANFGTEQRIRGFDREAGIGEINAKFAPIFGFNGEIVAFGTVTKGNALFKPTLDAYRLAQQENDIEERQRTDVGEGRISSLRAALNRDPLGARLAEIDAQSKAALEGLDPDSPKAQRIRKETALSEAFAVQQDRDRDVLTGMGLNTQSQQLSTLLGRGGAGGLSIATRSQIAQTIGITGAGEQQAEGFLQEGKFSLGFQTLANTRDQLDLQRQTFLDNIRGEQFDVRNRDLTNTRDTENASAILDAIDKAKDELAQKMADAMQSALEKALAF